MSYRSERGLGGRKVSFVASFGTALALIFAAWSWAGPVQVVSEKQGARKITLEAGKSVIVRSGSPVTRVASANDQIATVMGLSPTQVYVTGVAPGITNVSLWHDDAVLEVYDVEVRADISRLKEAMHQVLPSETDIQVIPSHDTVTLSGTVSSTENLSRAVALAAAYIPGKEKKVINLLQVAGVHQVMLEVRVAEMQRTLGNRLGINFAVMRDGSIGTSLLGNLASVNNFTGSQTSGNLELGFSQAINALFHIAGSDLAWTTFLDALKEEGLLKILAEPTLITLSGQNAEFLAGGEFPVPIPQGLGTVGIEWKRFGVLLGFTPTVLSGNKINLKVTPEVSDLDPTTAVVIQGVTVPGLTTRRVSTVIELGDGQSFAVAGLLRENIREDISKFPLLGEIPVLGALFRSTSFQKSETELIVIVTPRLVKPLDGARQPLPTDNYVEPTETELFLLGQMQGCGPNLPDSPYLDGRGGWEGEFGHTMP